ncbi:16469_t:CDS:2 [Funneliformis caledonium]|uniref:16469_t:CDS:1 n=1 Tax=Funneliformis caledonium TaxID=1117310 RepID=A0A9N8YUZ8_9GLOM|nr:16469_t:CDS:2 [Funneliformis caledonium]
MLLIRNLSTYLRVTGLNYDLQVAKSLYRLTSRRSYSNEADASAEMQVNDTQKSSSQDGVIEPDINGNSSKLNTNIEGRSSFANRLKAKRAISMNQTQTGQQRQVPLPSSMLRNWEKLDERLPLNPIHIRNLDPFVKGSSQNVLISKLPISAIRRDIEMLVHGIFPDEKLPIEIFNSYNEHYKPTGSAWIHFRDSKTALIFTKCTNQNIFYGNRLEVKLKREIPDRVRFDPLNIHIGRCVILTGLPRDMDEEFLSQYIKQTCDDKRFRVINISPNLTHLHDTSRWLVLLQNTIDSYHVFSRLHNKPFNKDHQMKARIIK